MTRTIFTTVTKFKTGISVFYSSNWPKHLFRIGPGEDLHSSILKGQQVNRPAIYSGGLQPMPPQTLSHFFGFRVDICSRVDVCTCIYIIYTSIHTHKPPECEKVLIYVDIKGS